MILKILDPREISKKVKFFDLILKYKSKFTKIVIIFTKGDGKKRGRGTISNF